MLNLFWLLMTAFIVTTSAATADDAEPEATRNIAKAYLNRAQLFEEHGDYTRAVSDYCSVIQLCPDSAYAQAALRSTERLSANILLAVGNVTGRSSELLEILSDDSNPEPRLLKNQLNSLEKTKVFLTYLLRAHPEIALNRLCRAQVNARMGCWEETVEDYREFFRILPREKFTPLIVQIARFDYGWANEQAKNYVAALAEYNKAMQPDESYRMLAWIRVAHLYERLGKPAESRSAYTHALNHKISWIIWARIAQTELAQERLRNAANDCHRSIEQASKDPSSARCITLLKKASAALQVRNTALAVANLNSAADEWNCVNLPSRDDKSRRY